MDRETSIIITNRLVPAKIYPKMDESPLRPGQAPNTNNANNIQLIFRIILSPTGFWQLQPTWFQG